MDTSRAPGELELVRVFVNTLEIDEGVDELSSPAALTEWLRVRGLLQGKAATRADLANARRLREALRVLLLANNGVSVRKEAAVTLNRAARRAGLGVRFEAEGTARGTGARWPCAGTGRRPGPSAAATPPDKKRKRGDPRDRRRGNLHRRRPPRRRRAPHGQDPDGARAGALRREGGGRGRRARPRALHARDDDRHECAPRAQGRGDRLRRYRGLRAPPPPSPPDPGPPVPALRGASGSASPARALFRRARASRARGPARAARPRVAAR